MSLKGVWKNILIVYRELFHNSKRACWQMPIYAVLCILAPMIESAIPALAIALLTEGNLKHYVMGIIAVILIHVMVTGTCIVLSNKNSMDIMGMRLKTFTSRLLEKSLSMDFCNVESSDNQKKMFKGMQAAVNGTRGVEGLVTHSFQLFYELFGLLSYGTIMFTIHWSILLIVAVTTVVTFFLKRHAIRYWHTLSDERNQASRINYMLQKQGISLEYGKDIRIYHVENWFDKIFNEQIRRMYRAIAKQELHWYFPTVGEQVGNFIRDIVMYIILLHLVLGGNITVAEFTFYVGIVAGFSSWMNQTVTHMVQVMETNVEVGYYMEAMDIQDVFMHGKGKKPDLSVETSIEFRDVSFRYEEEGPDILSHLSFKIEPGQKIALVGNNGAGKTTIVKLLCGFYLPTEGDVIVNGISTRDYDMDEYEKLISPVFQDGFMTAFTVAMNVAGGKEESIDRERVQRCLEMADVWNKISSLEQGEDTYITQQLKKEGVNFSGGEWQKLLIARALYKNGKCLILDEPTSALDPIAESQIYETYNEIANEKTSIFISHRLASTRFCDEIFYLEDGRIKERGTHEELIGKEGAYAHMYEIQSHYYRKQETEVSI